MLTFLSTLSLIDLAALTATSMGIGYIIYAKLDDLLASF